MDRPSFGSAGTAVITMKKAGLWTDSRYFLQAAEQLEGTDITLFKERMPETPSIAEWLFKELKEGDIIGMDGWVNGIDFKESLYPYTKAKGGLYDNDTVKEFFNYWSELNKSQTKMRWELQQTFEISKRLATWVKNEDKFSKNGKTEQANDHTY